MAPGSVDPGYHVTTIGRLRTTIGDVPPATRTKLRTTLDPFSLRFIECSPYVCVASYGTDGRADTSPRGDEPGFVKALDDQTLVMPERPGNRLADTLTNILDQPEIGMLFLVPGCPETLRVNGTAEIHDGPPSLLHTMAARGRTPKLAIVVRVAEVYMHCGRAGHTLPVVGPDGGLARSAPGSSRRRHVRTRRGRRQDVAGDLQRR